MTAPIAPDERVRLWDWPVRIVHWCFALLMPALWWTWKSGDMARHELLGYAALALVLFRIYWGFFGGETARFAGFVKGPRAIAGYVRRLFARESGPVVGHNPLGGWSVVLLLGLLAAQVVVGLFTQDVDGLESGPLTPLVSYEFAEGARYWHGFLFDLLLWAIGLHLSAILFYLLVKRDNLVGPMVTGRRRWPASPAPTPRHVPLWRAVPGMVFAGGIAWWVSLGCPL